MKKLFLVMSGLSLLFFDTLPGFAGEWYPCSRDQKTNLRSARSGATVKQFDSKVAFRFGEKPSVRPGETLNPGYDWGSCYLNKQQLRGLRY